MQKRRLTPQEIWLVFRTVAVIEGIRHILISQMVH